MRGLAIAATTAAVAATVALAAPAPPAAAAPGDAGAAPPPADTMRVVVRTGGAALAVARLRGQIADLDVEATFADAPLEPSLDAQLAAAEALADDDRARAVVWFVPRGGGVDVAVATPGDRRLFVRSIPPDDASAVAEAAAIAARGALRALADGGTIGVALPAPPPRLHLEASLGWDVALDGGADRGAHALLQRTALVRGAWAGALELSLGPPLRRGGDATLDLSRSAALVGVERRLGGGFAIGAAAGVVLYHRATITPPTGTSATPSTFTTALAAGPELRWRWRPGGGPVAIEALAALDVVAGAPELAVMDATGARVLGAVRTVQPRFGLSIVAGLP